MKLDLDLCRDILIAVEDDPTANGMGMVDIELPGRSPMEISYHVMQLAEAGLVEAHDLSYCGAGTDGFVWKPTRLTWAGHKFVGESRDRTFWEKAKEAAVKHGVPLTLEGMKAVMAYLGTLAMRRLTGEG